VPGEPAFGSLAAKQKRKPQKASPLFLCRGCHGGGACGHGGEGKATKAYQIVHDKPGRAPRLVSQLVFAAHMPRVKKSLKKKQATRRGRVVVKKWAFVHLFRVVCMRWVMKLMRMC
jgi:hypothetical protein